MPSPLQLKNILEHACMVRQSFINGRRTLQRERARLGRLDVGQQAGVLARLAGIAQEVKLADDAVQGQSDLSRQLARRETTRLVREGLDEASLRGGRLEQTMRRASVEQDLSDQSHVGRLGRTQQAKGVAARDDDHELRIALEVDERLRDDALGRERGRQSCCVSVHGSFGPHLERRGRRRRTAKSGRARPLCSSAPGRQPR